MTDDAITDDPKLAFEFDMDSLEIRAAMRRFLNKWYGEPCEEFDPDCPVCKVWSATDEFMCEVFDNPFRTGFITGELQ